MQTDRLTHSDMAGMMQKLAVNFGGKKDLEEKADIWFDKLRRYPRDIVERVVDRLLAEDHQYFPLIGRALKLAKAMTPVQFTDAVTTMRTWEEDPWKGMDDFADKQLCASTPCPVCGSVMEFSSRGAVIVHDDQKHSEARVSYSNIGKPEWFGMAPPVLPESWRKLKAQHRLEPPTLEQAMGRAQLIRSEADEAWEAEQMARAEAETAA